MIKFLLLILFSIGGHLCRAEQCGACNVNESPLAVHWVLDKQDGNHLDSQSYRRPQLIRTISENIKVEYPNARFFYSCRDTSHDDLAQLLFLKNPIQSDTILNEYLCHKEKDTNKKGVRHEYLDLKAALQNFDFDSSASTQFHKENFTPEGRKLIILLTSKNPRRSKDVDVNFEKQIASVYEWHRAGILILNESDKVLSWIDFMRESGFKVVYTTSIYTKSKEILGIIRHLVKLTRCVKELSRSPKRLEKIKGYLIDDFKDIFKINYLQQERVGSYISNYLRLLYNNDSRFMLYDAETSKAFHSIASEIENFEAIDSSGKNGKDFVPSKILVIWRAKRCNEEVLEEFLRHTKNKKISFAIQTNTSEWVNCINFFNKKKVAASISWYKYIPSPDDFWRNQADLRDVAMDAISNFDCCMDPKTRELKTCKCKFTSQKTNKNDLMSDQKDIVTKEKKEEDNVEYKHRNAHEDNDPYRRQRNSNKRPLRPKHPEDLLGITGTSTSTVATGSLNRNPKQGGLDASKNKQDVAPSNDTPQNSYDKKTDSPIQKTARDDVNKKFEKDKSNTNYMDTTKKNSKIDTHNTQSSASRSSVLTGSVNRNPKQGGPDASKNKPDVVPSNNTPQNSYDKKTDSPIQKTARDDVNKKVGKDKSNTNNMDTTTKNSEIETHNTQSSASTSSVPSGSVNRNPKQGGPDASKNKQDVVPSNDTPQNSYDKKTDSPIQKTARDDVNKNLGKDKSNTNNMDTTTKNSEIETHNTQSSASTSSVLTDSVNRNPKKGGPDASNNKQDVVPSNDTPQNSYDKKTDSPIQKTARDDVNKNLGKDKSNTDNIDTTTKNSEIETYNTQSSASTSTSTSTAAIDNVSAALQVGDADEDRSHNLDIDNRDTISNSPSEKTKSNKIDSITESQPIGQNIGDNLSAFEGSGTSSKPEKNNQDKVEKKKKKISPVIVPAACAAGGLSALALIAGAYHLIKGGRNMVDVAGEFDTSADPEVPTNDVLTYVSSSYYHS